MRALLAFLKHLLCLLHERWTSLPTNMLGLWWLTGQHGGPCRVLYRIHGCLRAQELVAFLLSKARAEPTRVVVGLGLL